MQKSYQSKIKSIVVFLDVSGDLRIKKVLEFISE